MRASRANKRGRAFTGEGLDTHEPSNELTNYEELRDEIEVLLAEVEINTKDSEKTQHIFPYWTALR